jgi:hypothetical protein
LRLKAEHKSTDFSPVSCSQFGRGCVKTQIQKSKVVK